MANSDKPFGLRPYSTLNGSPYIGTVRTYFVPATDTTAIYVGDPVKLAGGEGTLYPDDLALPTATKADSTDVVIGVCVGVKPLPDALSTQYRPASTAQYIMVDVDPQTVYLVQGDSQTWDATDPGNNANFTASTGVTTTGVSNLVVDQSTAATTATLDFQILGSAPIVGNDLTGGYPLLLVKLNNHQFVDGATGV